MRFSKLRLVLITLLLDIITQSAFSLSSGRSSPVRQHSASLKAALQKCYTPKDVLQLVANNDLTCHNNDSLGDVSSLCLVRLSKQLITLDNQYRHAVGQLLQSDVANDDAWKLELTSNDPSVVDAWMKLSRTLGDCMAQNRSNKSTKKDSTTTLESLVEGIKSMSVLSRILPDLYTYWGPCLEVFEREADQIAGQLQPHQLSGLTFAYDCFSLPEEQERVVPLSIQYGYDDLQLPFRVRPGAMSDIFADAALDNLVAQANFQIDEIRTKSNQVVRERRQTAWEGDDGVAPFAYSGKSMVTNSWSPLVKSVRDRLMDETGIYYDGCLLNLYPDGGSGMRYHSDPDQGVLWNYETAVVSVGATRRFSFREIPNSDGSAQQRHQQQPHTVVLMEGDVTEMFGDCQSRFQHTVKTADDKKEEAARASLVLKRTLSIPEIE